MNPQLSDDERDVLQLLAGQPVLSVHLTDPIFEALKSKALIEFDGLRYRATPLGIASLTHAAAE